MSVGGNCRSDCGHTADVNCCMALAFTIIVVDPLGLSIVMQFS